MVAIVCTLYEGEDAQFSWSKDGSILRSSGRIQIQNTAETSTLSIRNLRTSDGGNYTCIGSNPVSEERISSQLIVEGRISIQC